MLSLVDMMGMCDCTRKEIEAIAMHECVPDAIASELAAYLINCPNGVSRIRQFIEEDIEFARLRGHDDLADELDHTLTHFIASHSDYQERIGA